MTTLQELVDNEDLDGIKNFTVYELTIVLVKSVCVYECIKYLHGAIQIPGSMEVIEYMRENDEFDDFAHNDIITAIEMYDLDENLIIKMISSTVISDEIDFTLYCTFSKYGYTKAIEELCCFNYYIYVIDQCTKQVVQQSNHIAIQSEQLKDLELYKSFYNHCSEFSQL